MSDKTDGTLNLDGIVDAAPTAEHRIAREIASSLYLYEQAMREEYLRAMSSVPPMPSHRSAYAALLGVSYGVSAEPAKPKKPALDFAKLEALKSAEPYKVVTPMRIPDMVSVITAWRAWGLATRKGQKQLKALGVSHVWKPRAMLDAKCNNSKHDAPQMDCTCGVWAFKTLEGLTSALESYSDVKVLGRVSLWGRVVETENGYRAEKAYPSELWLFSEELEELGLTYDVPVRLVR